MAAARLRAGDDPPPSLTRGALLSPLISPLISLLISPSSPPHPPHSSPPHLPDGCCSTFAQSDFVVDSEHKEAELQASFELRLLQVMPPLPPSRSRTGGAPPPIAPLISHLTPHPTHLSSHISPLTSPRAAVALCSRSRRRCAACSTAARAQTSSVLGAMEPHAAQMALRGAVPREPCRPYQTDAPTASLRSCDHTGTCCGRRTWRCWRGGWRWRWRSGSSTG